MYEVFLYGETDSVDIFFVDKFNEFQGVSLLSTSLRGLEYLSYISMDCHTLKKDLFSCRQNKNVSQSEHLKVFKLFSL